MTDINIFQYEPCEQLDNVFVHTDKDVMNWESVDKHLRLKIEEYLAWSVFTKGSRTSYAEFMFLLHYMDTHYSTSVKNDEKTSQTMLRVASIEIASRTGKDHHSFDDVIEKKRHLTFDEDIILRSLYISAIDSHPLSKLTLPSGAEKFVQKSFIGFKEDVEKLEICAAHKYNFTIDIDSMLAIDGITKGLHNLLKGKGGNGLLGGLGGL